MNIGATAKMQNKTRWGSAISSSNGINIREFVYFWKNKFGIQYNEIAATLCSKYLKIERCRLLFNFLTFLAAAYISTSSHSAFTEFMLSALILIPLFLSKIALIRYEMNNEGNQIIKLHTTFSEKYSLLITLILAIVGAIFFIVVEWPVLWIRLGTPWLIVIALFVLDELYASRYLKKGLMENGVCTGHRFIEWGKVASFKWVRKNNDYSTLKIGATKFYSYGIAYLYVLNEQKEEVDGLFKKMVKGAK